MSIDECVIALFKKLIISQNTQGHTLVCESHHGSYCFIFMYVG